MKVVVGSVAFSCAIQKWKELLQTSRWYAKKKIDTFYNNKIKKQISGNYGETGLYTMDSTCHVSSVKFHWISPEWANEKKFISPLSFNYDLNFEVG